MPKLSEYAGKKVHEFLTAENWNQGSNFVLSSGERVNGIRDDAEVCKMCLLGAIIAAYPGQITRYRLLDTIDYTKCPLGLVSFNDAPHRKFEQVLALCKELDI